MQPPGGIMGMEYSFKLFKHLENNVAGHLLDQMGHLQKVVIDTCLCLHKVSNTGCNYKLQKTPKFYK